MSYNVDILVETLEGCELYRVNQNTAESLLRTENVSQAYVMVLAYGLLLEVFSKVEPVDGQILLDITESDQFGDFQNALMDLVCDLETE